jgi:predicted outer membrane lipoprotein
MLQELLLSVASGLIVALVLEYFRGRNKKEEGMTMSMPQMKPLPPLGAKREPENRGGSVVLRSALAILGGLGLAFLAANALQTQGVVSAQDPTALAALTVAGTLICWLLLAGLMRAR